MTSRCTTLTATNHNFNCVVKASLELINLPLIDILANRVKDVDLYSKINSCSHLLSGRNKLRTYQLKICYLKPPAIPVYRNFDVTLLYTLIRNLCPSLRPTQGWGNEPHTKDTQLGDDIERLRLFRNNYYAHAVSEAIPDTEFKILWKDLKSVISRIQSNGQTVCSVNYEKELIAIENFKYTHDYLKNCELLLKAFLEMQTDERDKPDVVIKGEDEVMCGDIARFEAVLKPDSSCWSITWQKRTGKVIEIIDTSTEKYSGSTNRKLVIQSVCKEDEGEYQVLLSQSNGNGYFKCEHTLCLHVLGELPILNDLEVTIEDEGIIIHYSYDVSEQSPEVQRLEWSKDGRALDMTTRKFVGGSIFDRILKIRLPTEDDKGKYSCKITNAVGSVSKSVTLGVPSVDILANSTVHFGSKAIIAAVVSSTPSPEQVKWQRSKDGNNFHCIDITKPKYYGSSDIPFKALLVIPKATFDDKLYYRLLVRNKIRRCISDTVYLNVTGSPPNITTSQETNTKNRTLKLIGNVSLYDGSPDIQEVFWTKNGEKIDTQGSGGRISEVTIDDPSLTIRHVSNEDAGNYQFTAVNAVGSTTSDVIVLDIPEVIFVKTKNEEDGSQRYLVTIQSVPSPFSVQWSSKGRDEDMYTQIDVNDRDYNGTVNTLPHPVLVLKKNQLEKNSYQIEVANFIGCTVKQISENHYHPTENATKENKTYKGRDAGIKFAKLSNHLAKHFPHQKIENLKLMCLASEKVKNVSALMSAKSASECFTILHEENLFTQKDVIFMQFLCKETGCDELYSQCINYALTNKALCYFEKPPVNLDNGYKKVQFHIQGYLKDYTKEHIKNIVEVVADILDCETQEIFVNGVKPSNSFFLVLSLKEVYSRRLSEMNKQDRLRLMKLNIDFFIVDFSTIFLQSREGERPVGIPETDMSSFLKWRRLHRSCSISNLSIQNKRSCLEIETDNKREVILNRNRPPENRDKPINDEKCQFSADEDYSNWAPLTSIDLSYAYTVPYSRSQSLSPPVVSAEDETDVSIDDNIMKIIEVQPYVQTRLDRGYNRKPINIRNRRRPLALQNYSKPPLCRSPVYSNIDTKSERNETRTGKRRGPLALQNYSKPPLSKSPIYSNIDTESERNETRTGDSSSATVSGSAQQ